MHKLILLGAAGLALAVMGPAFAADLPQMPVKATFVQRFTWTSCYLGAHVGGAWMRNDVTDPVLLVQDNVNLGGPGFTTAGPTTVGVNENGAVIGGQIGCDYQFPSNFVLGVEGAASGGTMKGSRLVALPDSPPDTASVSVKTDFVPTLTGRRGLCGRSLAVLCQGRRRLGLQQVQRHRNVQRRRRSRSSVRFRRLERAHRLDRRRRRRMGLHGRLVGEARIRLLRFRHPYRDDERYRQWSGPPELSRRPCRRSNSG